MTTDLLLPELGENITSGVVVKVLVQVGDTVEVGQPVVEIETDKAVVEVPADAAGVVAQVYVSEGDEITVGQKILSVEAGAAPLRPDPIAQPSSVPAEPPGGDAPAPQPAVMAEPPGTPDDAPEPPDTPERAPTPAAGPQKPPQRPKTVPAEPPVGDAPAPPPAKTVEPSERPDDAPEPPDTPERPPAPAAPSVRRFAREIGVDIHAVPGTGPGGRISLDDVKTHSKKVHQAHQTRAALPAGAPAEPLPDFARWGPVRREPMTRIRQTAAAHLTHAWTTVPHVTHFDKADVDHLEAFRKAYAEPVAAAGGRLTVTAVLVKIAAAALQRFPGFNASVDMAAREIVYKTYVNIGVAVDTDRGLLVPVIKDVDRMSLTAISVELTRLAEAARNRRLTIEEMQGGNFTVSNLGGIGGTGFTPIIHAPEVAILGVSRVETETMLRDGRPVERRMLPLALSYDHRVVDGADAARFLRWIASAVEQPLLIQLDG